jgi:dTMP kinase
VKSEHESEIRGIKKVTEKGFFICVEGLDKSGKTSQSILLVEALCKEGFDAVYTTEPSNGEIGRFIRRYVLLRNQRLPVVVEALLFSADRVDHNEKEIKPKLKEGKIVVCDRYVYSSLAYQGAAGLDAGWIKEINRSALKPDLAIYIDVPSEVVLQRSRHEKSVMEWPDIQEKVQEAYLLLVREGEMIPIDGNRLKEEVAKDIRKLVLEKLDH